MSRIGRLRYKATIFERVIEQTETGTDKTVSTARFSTQCGMQFVTIDNTKSEFNAQQLQRLKMECRYSNSIMNTLMYPERYFIEYDGHSYEVDHFETSIDKKWFYIYLRGVV